MPLLKGGQTAQGLDRQDVRYTVVGYYSFAAAGDIPAQGGAIGVINLVDEAGRAIVLPDNFVLSSATIETLVALTSGGSATVAIGTTESGKGAVVLAATAYSNAAFNAIDAVTAGTAALPYKVNGTTIAPCMTIATAALTAGEFKVVMHGYLGD